MNITFIIVLSEYYHFKDNCTESKKCFSQNCLYIYASKGLNMCVRIKLKVDKKRTQTNQCDPIIQFKYTIAQIYFPKTTVECSYLLSNYMLEMGFQTEGAIKQNNHIKVGQQN